MRTLLETKPGQCMFPGIGLKDAASFDCEEKAMPGSSYCVTHHRLCYMPPKKKLTSGDLEAMERAIARKRETA